MRTRKQLTLVSSVPWRLPECSHHLYKIIRRLPASLIQSVQTSVVQVCQSAMTSSYWDQGKQCSAQACLRKTKYIWQLHVFLTVNSHLMRLAVYPHSTAAIKYNTAQFFLFIFIRIASRWCKLTVIFPQKSDRDHIQWCVNHTQTCPTAPSSV